MTRLTKPSGVAGLGGLDRTFTGSGRRRLPIPHAFKATPDHPAVARLASDIHFPASKVMGIPDREHCQAANRTAADIEGHSTAAKFREPERLSARGTDGR
jgi:hypothetical protein